MNAVQSLRQEDLMGTTGNYGMQDQQAALNFTFT
jgi:hypothetical protein